MQVFIPYKSPFRCAACLDKRRLHKQVIECRQILNAIQGYSKGWSNHPVVKMYTDNPEWLKYYMWSLEWYRRGDFMLSSYFSRKADSIRPVFINEIICIQHRKRLFTKDKEHYSIFSDYGESYENWYIVDGILKIYKQLK